MANITPQNIELNRGVWAKLERYERSEAVKYDSVTVKIDIIFDKNPSKVGKGDLSVPRGYLKTISSPAGDECFYFENKSTYSQDIYDGQIDCK